MVGNADRAIQETSKIFGVRVRDYTAAPVFFNEENPEASTGAHQWLVEFMDKEPDPEAFARELDECLQRLNSDYEAKRTHTHTMSRLRLVIVPKGTFLKWMESAGKKGGQNKVPRLANDRKIIDSILGMLG